jgi:hypothetical protein
MGIRSPIRRQRSDRLSNIQAGSLSVFGRENAFVTELCINSLQKLDVPVLTPQVDIGNMSKDDFSWQSTSTFGATEWPKPRAQNKRQIENW